MKNEITFMFMGTLRGRAHGTDKTGNGFHQPVNISMERKFVIELDGNFCDTEDQFNLIEELIENTKTMCLEELSKEIEAEGSSFTFTRKDFYWSSRSLTQLKDWSRD